MVTTKGYLFKYKIYSICPKFPIVQIYEFRIPKIISYPKPKISHAQLHLPPTQNPKPKSAQCMIYKSQIPTASQCLNYATKQIRLMAQFLKT